MMDCVCMLSVACNFITFLTTFVHSGFFVVTVGVLVLKTFVLNYFFSSCWSFCAVKRANLKNRKPLEWAPPPDARQESSFFVFFGCFFCSRGSSERIFCFCSERRQP